MRTCLDNRDYDRLAFDDLAKPEFPVEYFDDPEEYLLALWGTGCRKPESILAHELAHANCAKALGATSVRYGITYDVWQPSSCLVDFVIAERIPRLAAASIYLAPIDPSDGDIRSVLNLGYVHHLIPVQKIYDWNETHETKIPIPGSLDPRASKVPDIFVLDNDELLETPS